MRILRKVLIGLVGSLCACSAAGCVKEMLHELQPWRLQRWNRGDGMDSGFEAYYSVRDEISRDETGVSADAIDGGRQSD